MKECPSLLDEESFKTLIEPLYKASLKGNGCVLLKIEFTDRNTGGLISFEVGDYKKWKRRRTNLKCPPINKGGDH